MLIDWTLAALLLLSTQQKDPSLALPTTVEFPLADYPIASAYAAGRRSEISVLRLKAAPRDPETVRLLIELGRYDEALALLREAVRSRPETMAAMFGAVQANARVMLSEKARNYAEDLRGIVSEARQTLERLPREAQAEVARALVNVDTELARDPGSWRGRLREFVKTYSGTTASLLAEVDLLTERIGPQMLEALGAFARDHPGTEAAAKAVYLKGFHLSHNGRSFGERPGADPTDRFFQVLEVSRELQSGKYPASEWVDKGAALPVQFYAYRATYAPGNAERILAALEPLLPDLLRDFEKDPTKDLLPYVIASRMGELHKSLGGGVAEIEGVYDRLAAKARNRALVLLLKAEFYLRPSDRIVDPKERPALREKAIAPLELAIQQGSGFAKRRALATLATLHFVDGRYERAAELYRQYSDAYAGSPYAWVAALRVARSEEARGRLAEGAALARNAAERFAANPLARMLGYAEAARMSERAADHDAALAAYKVALASWSEDYGRNVSLEPSRPAAPQSLVLPTPPSGLTLAKLQSRVAELTGALAAPGGALVERARWLIAQQQWEQALAPLSDFFSRYPRSPLAPEAERLTVRARLERALDLADADSDRADRAAALTQLNDISTSPPVFEACAVHIARAILTFNAAPIEGETIMADAMKCWKALDRDASHAAPLGALEKDVVEIRNVVFRPRGGGFYEGGRFDSYRWEGGPFQVVNSDLRVKLHDRSIRTVRAMDPFPQLDSIVYLDETRRTLLERLMVKLGGTKRREPTQIMQVPNQPVGGTIDIRALWKRFFFVQPGHWGGWVFETYPIITEIEFVDAARTKAAVKVTVGYSGATVQMEKKDGVWVAKELTNFWIT